MPHDTTETFAASAPSGLPARFGRYRILSELGAGGFGRVFLAHDELLKRQVAVKVLHLNSSSPALVTALLAEARIIAQLDHPGIVAVFDAIETEQTEFCIVSRFVEGVTLRHRLGEGPIPCAEAGRLAIKLCEALQYAHLAGVVHRDVKPANIMLAANGNPQLLDFGLAKSIHDVARDGMVAGTPGYMSPEQARGEDHLVGSRSDIYSLGVVFYEMLTGRRAFKIASCAEHLRALAAGEPPAPREVAPGVPKELSRICMKAMNPQIRWRYPVAADMADDLKDWLANTNDTVIEPAIVSPPMGPVDPSENSEAVRVVPRGLRAFDQGDSEFFLKLVPGPRDQYGLPESLRFWKQRIESKDIHLAFRVGVLYGPSGCGKSSLVGAGLLPRCAGSVRTIFYEARDSGNAVRLARTLSAKFPVLEANGAEPANLIHKVRLGGVLGPGEKLLVVIDQTEQWLRAGESSEAAETGEGTALLNMLRQCDGSTVQALLLVRDDFWRGVSRLLADADVEIDGNNSALVDLFDPRHAEAVLESFGRAYRCLPDDPRAPIAAAARAFIQRSVQNLAEGGKISPVRLTLFTEMFRQRPWTLASLRDVGGASGVAVAFLDDVFCAPSSGGRRRLHEQAARRVFEQLVPPSGDVRGPACPQARMLEASGYAERPESFHELLQILDAELRLITPVDPTADREPAWQLTHDHMVPALRQWLLARQALTRRGRAEITLAERAREWQVRPEPLRLPRFLEWFQLRVLTRRSRWSLVETDWMHAGMRRVRLACVCAILAAIVALLALGEWRNSVRGRALAEQILTVKPEEVAALVNDGKNWKNWTRPMLEQSLASPVTSSAGLNARLALVATDPRHAETLAAAMLESDARTFGAIRDALRKTASPPVTIFEQTLQESGSTNARRLRAVAALAAFHKDDPALTQVYGDAAHWLLTSVNDIPSWAAHLQPLAHELSPTLENTLTSGGSETHAAAVALAGLHSANAAELIRLLQVFPPAEVSLFVAPLRKHPEAPSLLAAALSAVKLPAASWEFLGKDEESAYNAESNLLLSGLSLGRDESFWPHLSRASDRTLRSYLSLNAAAAGVPAEVFATRLVEEKDAGQRQAILTALGAYPISALPAARREPLFAWLHKAFLTDPDAGVHSMVISLMKLLALTRELEALQVEARATPAGQPERDWRVTPSGVDMRIVAMKDGRRLALGACEVTVTEFHRFKRLQQKYLTKDMEPDPNAPIVGLSWVDAVQYCNWLTKREGLGPENNCYVETNGKWEAYPDALNRGGYRLPTKAEWLAGASSTKGEPWDFGRAFAHGNNYGWTAANAGDRPRPVGSLLPNEQGLWDVLGNATEWVHERRDFNADHLGELLGPDYTSFRTGLTTDGRFSVAEYPNSKAGLRLARSLGRGAAP